MTAWKGRTLSRREGYPLCFACGQENPIGLKLRFRREGDEVKGEFIPGEYHQGWPGIVHGGIINVLLDEVMAYAPHFLGLNCVTAKMEVRLMHPAPVGKRLLISSTISRRTRKLIEATGKIALEDGTTVAEGKATMYVVEEA